MFHTDQEVDESIVKRRDFIGIAVLPLQADAPR